MKILVIGNSGFIGQYLAQKLIEENHQIAGLDIQPMPKENSNIKFYLGDILNPADLEKAAEGMDLIINLAAKHHDFGVSKEEFHAVNVKGMENLLQCASKLGINKIIFYSSVAVYGDQKDPTTEQTAPAPVNTYGETKLLAENRIQEWIGKNPDKQAIIIRPTVVFGPNNFANMYNLINSIHKRRFFSVGKGENIKSVAYVENLVGATIFLLNRLKPGIQIFNYSDYPQLKTRKTVEIISKYLGCKVPKLYVPLGPVLAIASIFDFMGKITGYNFPITAKRINKFNTPTHHTSDKIRSLGFNPPVELEEGYKKTIEWYLKLP